MPETCSVCKGKGTVRKVPKRNYIVHVERIWGEENNGGSHRYSFEIMAENIKTAEGFAMVGIAEEGFEVSDFRITVIRIA